MSSKAVLAWTLSVAVFALLLASSQPFHSCVQEADKYYRDNASQKGVFDILIVLKTFKSCIGAQSRDGGVCAVDVPRPA